ncbi:hypothetical protein EPO05_03285 [Patescibacteria group bacterium]|nr:MAG: hypothetical protein EPO05_03285 [Patescibacteria group bacterium]
MLTKKLTRSLVSRSSAIILRLKQHDRWSAKKVKGKKVVQSHFLHGIILSNGKNMSIIFWRFKK